MNLDRLVAECRRQNELAWEELVRRFQGRVYGIALHSTHDAEEAREITQDVFLKLYQGIGSCPEGALFLPWLIRITRNSCIDHFRRTRARPPMNDVPLEKASRHLAGPDNPELRAISTSRFGLFYRALSHLTRLNRELIILKEIHELSIIEIASLLNIPIGTVKSRSNRARLELAERIMQLRGVKSGTVI